MGFYGHRKMDALTSNIFRSERTNGKLDGKKIKEVYSTLQSLCHAWASENVYRGRSGCSMFFEDGILYSYGYHYEAAKIYTNKKGEKLVLINNEDYSNSTGNHLGEIRSATKHLKNIRVARVLIQNHNDHAKNIEVLNNSIGEIVENIYKMRGYTGMESLTYAIADLNLYSSFFGLKNDLKIDRKNLDLLKECIKVRETKRESRGAKRAETEKTKLDKLKEENALRLAELKKSFPEFLAIYEAGNMSTSDLDRKTEIKVTIPAPFGRTKTQWLNIDIKEHEEKLFHIFKSRNYESVRAFRVGEENTIDDNFSVGDVSLDLSSPYALIRVKGNKVETSEGADVPLDHAIRLLKMILKNEAKSGERVGLYALETVKDDPKGDKTICIGCHKILLSEAKKVLSPYMNETSLKLVK